MPGLRERFVRWWRFGPECRVNGWVPPVRNPPAPAPAAERPRGHVPPRPIPAPAPRALRHNENADPTYPRPTTPPALSVLGSFWVGLGRLDGRKVVVLRVRGSQVALDRADAEAVAEMLQIAALEVDAGSQNGIDGSSGSGGLRSDSGISARQAVPDPSPLGANSMDAMDAATGSPHSAVRAAEMASSISTAE